MYNIHFSLLFYIFKLHIFDYYFQFIYLIYSTYFIAIWLR